MHFDPTVAENWNKCTLSQIISKQVPIFHLLLTFSRVLILSFFFLLKGAGPLYRFGMSLKKALESTFPELEGQIAGLLPNSFHNAEMAPLPTTS